MENTNNEKIVKSSIHYYCLNGLYRTMASLATEGQRMYPGDQTYRFYSGCSLAFEGRVQEAIRELERCANDRDLGLGAIHALIYSHSRCQVVDKDAIEALEKRLEQVKQQSNETTLYYGSLFLLLSKNFPLAQNYIEELNEKFPNYLDGKVLHGWLLVLAQTQNRWDPKTVKGYVEFFSKIIEPDVLIISAKLLEMLEQYDGCIEKLNQAIALYPKFTPALIEKIKIHTVLKEFELLLDTALRALALDKHCIEPQRYLIIYYLAWDFSEESALSKIQDLISSLELREPKNGQLYYESSRLICRLAFQNEQILIHSSSLIERAVFLDPTNIDFVCEFAFQCALLKRFPESQRHYKNAAKLNAANPKPIIGLLIAKLIEYDCNDVVGISMMATSNTRINDSDKLALDKIHEEINHLEEFNKTTTTDGLSLDLLFLCLKSNFLQHQSYASIEPYLLQIFNQSQQQLKDQNLSVEFYANLPTYQLTNIVEICLSLCGGGGGGDQLEPLIQGQKIPEGLKYAKEFCTILLQVLPNHKEILYRCAMVKYMLNDIRPAMNMANRCLQYDPKFLPAYLLMAKMAIHDRNFRIAQQSLDNALVLDFQIRNNLNYILAKASILKHERKYQEALELLQSVAAGAESQQESLRTDDEKLSIDLQLIDIHLMLNNLGEAKKILQKLMNDQQQHQHQHQSVAKIRGRIQLCQARIHVVMGDYENALQTLQQIRMDQGDDNFIRSRQMMAAIYLSKYKDRKRFTDCYKDVMEQFPSEQAQLMLGDAYMHILEPETAIDIYEGALKKNPKDYALVSKVGQTLIKAHFYERAVTYYKAAIKSSGQSLLFCLDLANLLARLQRNDQAKDVINSALKSFDAKMATNQNLDVQIIRIKLLESLAKVYLQSGNKEVALNTLRNAHVENQKLMRRLPVEHPDLLEEHRKFSINLCKELAHLLSTYGHDDRQALQIYKDSLQYDTRNNDIYLQMAKIELNNENFDLAHGFCTTILKYNPNMDEAILMMADITFRQGDFEGALNLYHELLNKNITYFTAMERFIEACRRFGKLKSVPEMLNQAENRVGNPNHTSKINTIINNRNTSGAGAAGQNDLAGLYYCKGLYEWYTGNSNEAVKNLSMVRNDPMFGRDATILLIEICIHPDYQSLSDPSMDMISRSTTTAYSSSGSVKTAEALVEVLKLEVNDGGDDGDGDGGDEESIKIRLLNNLVLLAKKQKTDSEYVLQDLLKLASQERYNEHVGIIYTMAMAYMTLKQTPKARNQLKRIAKQTWRYTDAEYLEKAWLLLSDIYIQNNKFDNANELLRKILRYNRSCFKANEYCGYILEKEQNYREAAFNYEQAWLVTERINPILGYKYAYNLMKSKRYADAIDVCQTILGRYPQYPKIRKEILDKCVNNLKT